MLADEAELIQLALDSHRRAGARPPADIVQTLLRLSARRQGDWPDGLFHQLVAACHGAWLGHGRPVPGALIGAAITEFSRRHGK